MANGRAHAGAITGFDRANAGTAGIAPGLIKGFNVLHAHILPTYRAEVPDGERVSMQFKKCITSSGLNPTGSLNGFMGIGMSFGDQCCLSVARYSKRSAEVAVSMLEADSLRFIVR
jgi:hypothetical protein